MKYQLVIQRLETEVMLSEEKLKDYKEIDAIKDNNAVVKGMVEMYKERIKQYNDAIKLLKSANTSKNNNKLVIGDVIKGEADAFCNCIGGPTWRRVTEDFEHQICDTCGLISK